mmetsp:Transcript_31986/g.73561  ORF Transcript_31986/g.73561 Transcript_31986/m.73561 type:complete len:234 (+) Transcript_31986:184-885(+)
MPHGSSLYMAQRSQAAGFFGACSLARARTATVPPSGSVPMVSRAPTAALVRRAGVSVLWASSLWSSFRCRPQRERAQGSSRGPARSREVDACLEKDALVLLDEPLVRRLLGHAVRLADAALLLPPHGHAAAPRALHHHVEVHTVDARRRVVLETEIDVLLDAEAEVAVVREVLLLELVLLHLEAALKHLLRLLATDGHVHRNLLVTADAERAHGVARAREDGRLARELLEHPR